MLKRKGYTIVELVVVVAIIGVLLSMSLAGVSAARVRSRDARRIADLRSIQSALEMHAFNDDSHSYPPESASDPSYCGGTGSSNFGIYANACFAKYLATTPTDPQTRARYSYYRPACVTGATNAIMQHAESQGSCAGTFSVSYGLHAALEADNTEARNDASPNDARNYDLFP